jgi:TldD protein
MKNLLKDAIRKSSAEYIDARHEKTESMEIVFNKKEIRSVSSSVIDGGHVRALKDGGIAYQSFTDPRRIDEAVGKVESQASAIGRHARVKDGLAEAETVVEDVKSHQKIDPREVPFEEKKRLVEEYIDLVMSVPGVTSTTPRYTEKFTTETFVSSEGTQITQEILLCRVGGVVIAQDGNRVEMNSFSIGYDSDFARLQNRHDYIEHQAKIAADMVKAEFIRAGRHTVVCDPNLGGVFTHEAFGHLSESDDTVNNPSLQREMKIGRILGSEVLNIYDQGNFPEAPGSYTYDHEGVATGKTPLIEKGVLVGRLISRNTAFHLGGKPTGNYRSRDFRINPIVRQSNIFIEQGDTPVEEMLASVDDGYYLFGGKGGQTMGDIFTFGAWYGYKIEKGRIGNMVTEINISGNVFNTLKNITMIGNDFRMTEWGGCGKTRAGMYNMQMIPKSGTGSPTIKIENVVIGGR